MPTARILVATDLPYWRNTTGSHRRIFAQVNALTRRGMIVRTFFLGSLDLSDPQLIKASGLDVEAHQSDTAPTGIRAKVAWWLEAIKHSLGTSNDGDEESVNKNLTLDDFRWPWVLPRFAQSVKSFSPTSIIIQYVKLAWLLEAMNQRQRNSIQTLIDTHDVQHRRAEQFRQRGHGHWLAIDRQTETNALEPFDVLIAIQPEEAAVFRNMLPNAEIILCGHELSFPENTSDRRQPTSEIDQDATRPLRAGYLASANAANFDAIKNFLLEAWIPHFHANDPARIQLVVGGGVGDQIVADKQLQTKISVNERLASSIKRLGPVQDLSDFYDQIDVVVNPIGFGAGLKIKNCEAIAYAKPLLTTDHGATGIDASLLKATVIGNSPVDLMTQMIRWQTNPKEFQAKVQLAVECQEAARSSADVYDELVGVLKRNL